jgi:hypothetical protein
VSSGRAREGDDRWGSPISRARRGAKGREVGRFLAREAAMGRAPPKGDRLGREGRLGRREAEAQWGEGERPVGEGKRKWAAAGSKTGAGPNSSNKIFLNFYLEFEFLATLEICRRRFRRNFDIRIFPKFFEAPQGF